MMSYIIWTDLKADLIKLVVTAYIVTMVTEFFVRRRQPLEVPKEPLEMPKSQEVPNPKSLTFRVDGIPVNHADELLRNLKTLAEQDPDLRGAAATMAQRSLTPRDKLSACATISVTTTLSGGDLCARLQRSGKGYPYSYTCEFGGITPLYEDKNGADVEYEPLYNPCCPC